MKQSFSTKCLFGVLSSIYISSTALQAGLTQSALRYEDYIKRGDKARADKDFSTALINFKEAQSIRPKDQYATKAIGYILRDTLQLSNKGAPNNKLEAGTRTSGKCSNGGGEKNLVLTAIVPKKNPVLTAAEYPVLFFYIPLNGAQSLKFSLEDENETMMHSTSLALPETSGIISIDLSNFKEIPSIKSGENYHWYLSMICDPQDRSADIAVSGSMRRTEPSLALASRLKLATLHERSSLYAGNRIWFDTLATLHQARQANPDDPKFVNEWIELLKLAELDGISREPLVQCCTEPINQEK